MKRLVLMVFIIFLASCEVASEEVVLPPSIDVPEIEEESTQSVDIDIEDIDVVLEPSRALMSNKMPIGAYQLFIETFGRPFQWYSLFNIDRLFEYELVYLFYDAAIEQQLKDRGYEWPPLNPYETVRVNFNEKTEVVLFNASDSRFMDEAIPLFLSLQENITNEVVSLFQPLEPMLPATHVTLSPKACQIPNAASDTVTVVGFPLYPQRVSSIGQVKAKVLYLEFADYRMNQSNKQLHDLFSVYGNPINRFFEQMSYGTFSFEWDVHPEPLLMPKTAKEYALTYMDNFGPSRNHFQLDPTLQIVYDMLDLHRDNIDFTDAELMIIMFNPALPRSLSDFSPAHLVRDNRDFVTNQGPIYNATTICGGHWGCGDYKTIAHELGHLLGLLDFYDYTAHDELGSNPSWEHYHRHMGGHDLMGWHHGNNPEFIGWNRYLLNWITEEQVHCVEPVEEISELIIYSVAHTDPDPKLIVFPLGEHQVLVVEARTKNMFCTTCDGLLIYTVDTNFVNGRGPVKLQVPERSVDPMYDDGMLRVGESMDVGAIRISLEEAARLEFRVRFQRISANDQ